jgi:hypothetical protein
VTGFEWNQIDTAGEDFHLRDGLLLLFARRYDQRIEPIGTAFVVGIEGNVALAITAAHNVTAIRKFQQAPSRFHPSTPAEFRPPAAPLKLEPRQVQAIAFSGDQVISCPILLAAWDEAADVAFLSVDLSDRPGFVTGRFEVTNRKPRAGDEVALAGFEGAKKRSEAIDGPIHQFELQTRMMIRTGRVTDVSETGMLLCRGPCLSTSIPVFPGMSGGPAFFVDEGSGKLEVFELICADSELEGSESKNDRSLRGMSTIALFNSRSMPEPDGTTVMEFMLSSATVRDRR